MLESQAFKYNKRIKVEKILLIALLSIVSLYAKENSGLFIGVDVSGNIYNEKTTQGNQNIQSSSTTSVFGLGGKVGYKHFFNDSFGLRGYGMLSFATNSLDGNSSYIKSKQIIYTLNVDLLYNFYSNNDYHIGVFSGFGVGGANVKGKVSGTLNDSISEFYGDIKLGLKISYGFNSISFIASFLLVPVEESTFVGAGFPTYNSTLKTNYAISLAYDYRF